MTKILVLTAALFAVFGQQASFNAQAIDTILYEAIQNAVINNKGTVDSDYEYDDLSICMDVTAGTGQSMMHFVKAYETLKQAVAISD